MTTHELSFFFFPPSPPTGTGLALVSLPDSTTTACTPPRPAASLNLASTLACDALATCSASALAAASLARDSDASARRFSSSCRDKASARLDERGGDRRTVLASTSIYPTIWKTNSASSSAPSNSNRSLSPSLGAGAIASCEYRTKYSSAR